MKANFRTNLPFSALILAATLIFATSCRSQKTGKGCLPNVSRTNPDVKTQVFKAVDTSRFNFEHFTASVSGNYFDGSNEYSMAISLRMKKDEKIWMSVSMLFFEVARVLIDKDSVYIIDYYNKAVTIRSLDFISNYLGTKMNIGQVQDVLVGNSILKHDNNSSLGDDKEATKVISRIGQFLFEETFNRENYRPFFVKSDQTGGENKMELTYTDYTQVNCRLIPKNLKLSAVTNTRNIRAELKYSDISTEPITNWPFTIPAKYERN